MHSHPSSTLRWSARAAALFVLGLGQSLLAQSEFAGRWSGSLNPGSAFVLEIGASGTTARLTVGGQVEPLRFIGYSPEGLNAYYWREQDHAAISVFSAAGVTRFAYLEAYYLRTATLTLVANVTTEFPAGGAPTPPATTPTLFAGLWSGQLAPGPAFEIGISAAGAAATFKDAGLGLEELTFVGYEPTTPALYYWRAQDHAVVSLYAQGGGVDFSYLEQEVLRTGTLVQPGDDCAVLLQTLNDALAELAQTNASVTSLTQQLAAAQSQITQLAADKSALQQQLATSQTQVASLQTANAALTQQLAAAQALVVSQQGSLSAATASLNRVQGDFRTEFNNASFVLPGATFEEKIDNLASAIIELSHGRAIGLYDNLR